MKLPVIVTVSRFEQNLVNVSFTPRPFTAWCPYFPELRANGETKKEAIEKLGRFLKEFFESGDVCVTELNV